MDQSDLNELAHALIPVAQAAGKAILSLYETDFTARYKADLTPVTDADIQAENIILNALAKLLPDVSVIAEEQVAAGHIPASSNVFFLVDALDGTREFVNKTGHFTVNIALVKNKRPIFGMIYSPIKQDYYATLGETQVGLFQLDAYDDALSSRSIDFQIIEPLPAKQAIETVWVGQTSHSDGARAYLQRFGKIELMTMGSSFKFCKLCKGEGDLYPRFAPTSEWDIAAGQAILEASGGCVVAENGQSLLYGKRSDNFVNPSFIAWRSKQDFEFFKSVA